MFKAPKPINLKTVLKREREAITARRDKMGLPKPEDNLVGIALSGGGERSATVCLGVLDVFNENKVLEKADYLSSVSGGGYTASYIHATLKKHGSNKAAFEKLFNEPDIKQIREFGSYLAPDRFGYLKLVGTFVFSFVMNLAWVLLLFALIGAIANCIFLGFGSFVSSIYAEVLLCSALIVIAIHFFLHVLRPYLWSSHILNITEGIIFIFAVPYVAHIAFKAFADEGGFFTHLLMECHCTAQAGYYLNQLLFHSNCWVTVVVFLVALGLIGFFANPNILTLHRFYRDSLARAYLFIIKGVDRAFKLYTLNPGKGPQDWGAAPYPLVNTCLNLSGKGDKSFSGTRSNEHFILSPLYCGSKITGYAPSNGAAYENMSLPTAMAISGAAICPQMGYRTNRFLAFIMTILNMRLGYWAPNPKSRIFPRLSWWPCFHLAELFSFTNTRRKRVLLSDGGHIENLGVFELLRRRCRLIFVIDAGADPNFEFKDLQELIIQARNILGVKIEFAEKPEDIIRPTPSCGYSKKQFAIASLSDLDGAREELKGYRGIMVYIKSSVKAPETVRKSRDQSYLYKTWHPAFPQEGTSDQFFDHPQWDAYYTLGKHMAEEVLRNVVRDKFGTPEAHMITPDQWFDIFEKKRLEVVNNNIS